MEDNFKIVWSDSLIFQAWGLGTREVTWSMLKGQLVEKGRNPKPLILGPAPSHRSLEASMLACSCLAVFSCHLPVSWFSGYYWWILGFLEFLLFLPLFFIYSFLPLNPPSLDFIESLIFLQSLIFLVLDLQQPLGPALPCAMVAASSAPAAPHKTAGWPGASGNWSWSVCFPFHPQHSRRHWRWGWLLHRHLLTGQIPTGFLTCPQVFLGSVPWLRQSVMANDLSGPYAMWAFASSWAMGYSLAGAGLWHGSQVEEVSW